MKVNINGVWREESDTGASSANDKYVYNITTYSYGNLSVPAGEVWYLYSQSQGVTAYIGPTIFSSSGNGILFKSR